MSTKTAVQRETFALTLDSSVRLEEMIRRGNYAFVNERYTPQDFKLSLTGRRQVVLFDPLDFVSFPTNDRPHEGRRLRSRHAR